MSSEFTLDIQLTELGFSNWNFPLCEPQSVKETFLPTQNNVEKSVPETQTLANDYEEACNVPSGLAEKSFLQDHQYSSPIKPNSTINAEDNSKTVTTENREKAIFSNKWKTKKRQEAAEQRKKDKEQSREEEKSTNEKEQCSEVSQKASSLLIDGDLSGEEKTDEDAEFYLTDDEEEEEEEEEEEDDDDISCSETNGSEENGENHCHVCDVTFPSLFLLREHLNMHTGVRPYRCDECGKQFCQLVNYRTHLRSHSQKASIHCRVCSTNFETEEQLQEHLDTNHFEKEFYQCDFCKQIFTDLEVCQDHVERHRQQAKRHLCLKCGSSFRHRNSLLRHLEWHSRGVFSCSDCDRTFSSKASLLRHSFSHSGVLPYTCLKCKRHFRLPSLYRNHECKPDHIQCMACLVFFQSQEDFEKHKKDTGCWGHQGSLPSKTDEIRCMECGQVCASVEELKKHGSTHQRVLKCAECGMGFRSALMLMSHMGGHAAQRPCLCKDCGLGFPHQQGYDSHLKTCGLVTPPVAPTKKPKLKKIPSPQVIKPIAPNIIFQTFAQDSNLAALSHNKEAHTSPSGDQKQPADGVWKLTLNKEPPPGVPLVMLLPVPSTQSSSTSDPNKISQNILPSSLVLETPSSAPCVISMPMVPLSPVISKEAEKDIVEQCETNIPANKLIPNGSDDGVSKKRWTLLQDKNSVVQAFGIENLTVVGEQSAGLVALKRRSNVTAKLETKNEHKSPLKHKPSALISDVKDPQSSSEAASLNPMFSHTPLCLVKEKNDDDDNIKKRSASLKDGDRSPVMGEVEGNVPLTIIAEKQALQCTLINSGLVLDSSEMTDKVKLKSGSENQRFFKEAVSPDSTSVNSMSDSTSTGDKSGNWLQEENTCDVEVEINEEMEVEIGDEDSGVDMLEGELHECVTCGQVLPEKDMIQHYMKHAAVTDSPRLSPIKCASHTTEQSPPCSPPRKRQRSGTSCDN